MNFKSTKLKVIISIVVIIVWYILYSIIWRVNPSCSLEVVCPSGFGFTISDCPNLQQLLIPQDSCCSCPSGSFSEILLYLLIVLAPGILIYVLWSLGEKKK